MVVVGLLSLAQEPYECGNVFYERGSWDPGNKKAHTALPRQSIMREYLRVSNKSQDVPTLAAAVSTQPRLVTSRTRFGAPDIVVVHLRMGDNIVEPSCWSRGCRFNGGEQNPLSRTQFEACLAMWGVPFAKVVLFGSFNGGGWAPREQMSRQYYADVLAYFRMRNTSVDSRVTHTRSSDWRSVDRDIVSMSQAQVLVCSGGTFSTMVGALVHYNGGKTCGCEPDWS